MNEFWDARYSESDYVYGKKPNKYFEHNLLKLNPGKLLLPAEGEGRNAVFAAENNWLVTAVDFSSKAKEKALKLANERNVSIEYVIAPLEKYAFPENEFDAVGLIYAHFPRNLRTQIHNSVIKSLKPGGILIFEAFSKKQINNNTGGPKDISLLYDLEELFTDFRDLRIEESQGLEIELTEGKYHKGKSDIIRLIAKKHFLDSKIKFQSNTGFTCTKL